jgi:HD-like signal output (HDOD) protein
LLFRRRRRDEVVLDDILQGYELPSFPAIVTELLARLSDPDVSMAEVAKTIELDPGLSVKLMRLANSAATGLRQPVTSIQQVATLLGRNQIESILISSSVKGAIPKPRSEVFDHVRFWRAAACRAVIATSISNIVEPRHRSETFTAALLQDMALPLLVDNVDGYAEVLAGWYAGEVIDLAEAEGARFGWDHAMIGAQMCERWGFPLSLADPISRHHTDDELELVGVRAVAPWHEVDEEAGRQAVIDYINGRPELAPLDADAMVDDALSRVGEVAALFV